MAKRRSGRFLVAVATGLALVGGALVSPAAAATGEGRGEESVTAQLSCPYVVTAQFAYVYPTPYTLYAKGVLLIGRKFRSDPASLENGRLRLDDTSWVKKNYVKQNGQCAV
ncbi:hypothetical protein [Streptomyces alkaliterrae]|uniref:SH3 domain-containing protein n=1 Tax=Streptomyces alkaliterrae TaxID=2213162 RepID=A0A5P0YQW1_9ACTN|nr:hypothetical protein [Streptomyces alkaliterrae]MBB1258712.1 hypothetical protein [Streptomyces alkaliterrae]MQS02703.1 hypothetical protein [Streptomyces alkaliterrae]